MSIWTQLRTGLAATGALVVLFVTPASATVVDQGRFVDEPYGFSYSCGFPVEVTGVASGNFRLREGKGDDAGAFFSLERMSFREIHTNPETGAWFSVSGHFASNEITASRVDGSLFEFRTIKAGQPSVIEDAAGNLIARDRGDMRVTILFDTGGDDEPGGTFVDLIAVDLKGPHPAFGNLCSIATDLIGLGMTRRRHVFAPALLVIASLLLGSSGSASAASSDHVSCVEKFNVAVGTPGEYESVFHQDMLGRDVSFFARLGEDCPFGP